ncbi:hypothetical protein [Cetobacterium sp.]|uniref:hypothetical protein n=1 Tax=Cetobacterium sp. TaxID=2071632 RepID=UPI003EE5FBB4
MDKKILDNIYKICQEASMNNDEFFYLLENSKSEEEKEFYVNMKNFFLQKRMEKVISQNKF